MKKFSCFLLLFTLVFCFTACQAEKNYSIESVTAAGEPAQYKVTVFGRGKSIIYETTLYGEPEFTTLEKGILRMKTGAGNVTQYRFFDTVQNRVSPTYENPELVQDGKIVYMTLNERKLRLVVRDIFDETVFYRTYDRDFSKTAVPADVLTSAAFIGESTLKVTYLSGENFEMVEETLRLQ